MVSDEDLLKAYESAPDTIWKNREGVVEGLRRVEAVVVAGVVRKLRDHADDALRMSRSSNVTSSEGDGLEAAYHALSLAADVLEAEAAKLEKKE